MGSDGRRPCVVVPISLRPYPETEEIACIGVLLHSPTDNRFGYRLAKASDRAFRRASGFFRETDAAILKAAIKCAEYDIRHMIELATEVLDPRLRENAFHNLIRPRENIIRYGHPKAVLTDDFEKEKDLQYERIVQRSFIDREGYYEQRMRTRVMGYLTEKKICFERQRKYTFENGNYSFSMPITIGKGSEIRLIKPLNFIMKSRNDTFDHWFKWQRRFEYLRGEGLGKNRILVPVRLPSSENADIYNAAMVIFSYLQDFAHTVNEEDKDVERSTVVSFAS